ncbi:MAG: hypothetical protein NTV88_05275 [Candidatus Micrarchaeota archaeon]|nr:hypothetical protein [Candidatus Micrarchaeota archaeon]
MKRGQAASEYIILLAIALVVMMLVTTFVYIWPSYTYSVKKQRADDYWANARPFAVKSNMIVPNQLVLEIENTEPVTLTITALSVDGTALNFYSHPVPFTWAVTDMCGSGDCALPMRPGAKQIISTYNFTDTPINPCILQPSISNFETGYVYEIDFAVTYYATDPGSLETQSGKLKMIGSCTAR